MTSDRFCDLPSVEAVREWATELTALRGDASFYDGIYTNGLRIEDGRLDEGIKLVRENVGAPHEGGVNIAVRIQLAIYPDADFAEPFWNKPERSQLDIPMPQGAPCSQRHNDIYLPYPQVQPVLVRVEEWHRYCEELRQGNIVTVSYTLYELDPETQRKFAEERLSQAIPAQR